MCNSSFANSCLAFAEKLEIELAQRTSMVEHSPNAPSTSGFHLHYIPSYFRAFFVDSPPHHVHLASAADKSDPQEGKGNAQEQPVMVQEFMSYIC
jgi:hypothetical protein